MRDSASRKSDNGDGTSAIAPVEGRKLDPKVRELHGGKSRRTKRARSKGQKQERLLLMQQQSICWLIVMHLRLSVAVRWCMKTHGTNPKLQGAHTVETSSEKVQCYQSTMTEMDRFVIMSCQAHLTAVQVWMSSVVHSHQATAMMTIRQMRRHRHP